MARAATGQVLELARDRGRVYALRFRAGGKRQYVTLGTSEAGWNLQRAEAELQNVLADVRRGIWRPPTPEPIVEVPTEEPTFHEYASEWLAQRAQEGLAAKTITDLRWSLVNHLLPFFAEHRLSQINAREVKRYTQAKLAERNAIEEARAEAIRKGEPFSERSLSNSSINKTTRHLGQVLAAAVDDEILASNPASDGRRRLKASRPARPWVEPEQLMALLEPASGVGRILLAVLAGSGLRIGEALALRWRDVDLGSGTLYVVKGKTAASVREVHLSAALREELTIWRADALHAGPTDYVIHTSSGRRCSPSNLRRDVLAKAVTTANVKLEEAGIAPLGNVTFHSLRRTYASLRCVCGDDIAYTASQLGHEDARFTLRCYAQASKRRERLSKPHREAFDRALHWAALGTSEPLTVLALLGEATKNPV